MADALLPCPFCGRSALLGVEPHERGFLCIRCRGCGAIGPALRSETETEAIAAWNTRSLSAPAPAPAEAVAWQWRRKGEPWSLDKTFNSQVYATTPDSEVRPLYAAPAAPAGPVLLKCCAKHEGQPFTLRVSCAVPSRIVCPICDPEGAAPGAQGKDNGILR